MKRSFLTAKHSICDRDEEHGSSNLASEMTSTCARMESGREIDQSSAQAAYTDLPGPDSSSEHNDEFATATSSPAETGSEEDNELAFRLRSRSHSQEYEFLLDRSHSFHLGPY